MPFDPDNPRKVLPGRPKLSEEEIREKTGELTASRAVDDAEAFRIMSGFACKK